MDLTGGPWDQEGWVGRLCLIVESLKARDDSAIADKAIRWKQRCGGEQQRIGSELVGEPAAAQWHRRLCGSAHKQIPEEKIPGASSGDIYPASLQYLLALRPTTFVLQDRRTGDTVSPHPPVKCPEDAAWRDTNEPPVPRWDKDTQRGFTL